MPVAPVRAISEIDLGLVNSSDMVEPNILDYALMQSNNCTSAAASSQSEIAETVTKCAAYIRLVATSEIRSNALSGQAEDRLELAIRYGCAPLTNSGPNISLLCRLWTGCGVLNNKEDAMFWWSSLTESNSPLYNGSTPRSILARTYSCLANIHFDDRFEGDNISSCNVDALYRAARYADQCAALGLTSGTVQAIGQFIVTNSMRGPVPGQGRYTDPGRFTRLDSLWEAIDRRTAEFDRFMQNLDDKVWRGPNASGCAFPGCGIVATSKFGLMRCAGPCPMERKPSYCDKHCQRKVRCGTHSNCADD